MKAREKKSWGQGRKPGKMGGEGKKSIKMEENKKEGNNESRKTKEECKIV